MPDRKDIAQVYVAKNGEWDWRIIAANGEPIAGANGETYKNRGDVTDMLEQHFPNASIVILDEDGA